MTTLATTTTIEPAETPNLPAVMSGQHLEFGKLTPETPIALSLGGAIHNISARDVIKWVAPDAPLSVALQLLVTAQNLGLNPLVKEIEPIQFGGKWTLYVRKSGLVKAAHQSPHCDGWETGITIQDVDETTPERDIPGELCPRGYKIRGGWAKVYRKGWSRPIFKRVDLQPYYTGKGNWLTNPGVMIVKVALMAALREAFTLGEVYSDAELPGVAIEDDESDRIAVSVSPEPPATWPASSALVASQATAVLVPEIEPPTQAAKAPTIDGFDLIDVEVDPETLPYHERPCKPGQIAEIKDLLARGKFGPGAMADIIRKRGCETPEQLTIFQAQEISLKLQEKVSKLEFQP